MNYSEFSTDDFIKDDHFQRWVLSPDESTIGFWDNFIRLHPHKQAEVQEARQFLLLFHLRENDVFQSRISSLKKRIDAEIDQTESHSIEHAPLAEILHLPRKGYAGMSGFRKYWYAAAAVVTLVLVTTALYFLNPTVNGFLSFSLQNEVTARGHRTFVTLEDGTKIWLNADSRLTYPKSFSGEATREIQLEGEAYFDVAENKQKPFIVHTSDIRIKVLGTSFNVKSYGKDRTIETTLIKGKVTIESSTDSKKLTLLPNQQAVFEKESKKLFLEHKDKAIDYTSWRDGQLVFDDRPLADIVNELERWFNVTIEVEDRTSLNCHFSASVNNKTLEEVMELFKDAEAIDYRIDGAKVFISGKLCK
jgi:ferric-dicitrate binding protein FerR (iron transport regulator)